MSTWTSKLVEDAVLAPAPPMCFACALMGYASTHVCHWAMYGEANSPSRGGWILATVVESKLGGDIMLEYGPDSSGVGAFKVVVLDALDVAVKPWYTLGQLVKFHYRCSRAVGF
eukprot:6330775-Amphidinium_carterae.1